MLLLSSTKHKSSTTMSFATQTILSCSTKLLDIYLERQAMNPKREELDVSRTATHTSWKFHSRLSSTFLDNKYLVYKQPHNSRFATLTCRFLVVSSWWKFFWAWSTLLYSLLSFVFRSFHLIASFMLTAIVDSQILINKFRSSAIPFSIHQPANGRPSRNCSRS